MEARFRRWRRFKGLIHKSLKCTVDFLNDGTNYEREQL